MKVKLTGEAEKVKLTAAGWNQLVENIFPLRVPTWVIKDLQHFRAFVLNSRGQTFATALAVKCPESTATTCCHLFCRLKISSKGLE